MKAVATRRITALICVLGMACVGSLSVAATADARQYPGKVRLTFLNTCVSSALESSNNSISKAEARRYCSVALKCIEKRLTLAQYIKLEKRLARTGKVPKVLRTCQKQGLDAIT